MRALWLTGSLALFALGGCSVTSDAFVSPPLNAYGPASASVDGLGYDALRITPETWRVWYTANARADRAQVEQYALRHAAETVHTAGYDWFRIRYDATPRHASGYRPVNRSGEITPAYVDDVQRAGPMGLVRNWIFREGPQGQITAILDVEGGRGARPGGAYDPVVIIGSYP